MKHKHFLLLSTLLYTINAIYPPNIGGPIGGPMPGGPMMGGPMPHAHPHSHIPAPATPDSGLILPIGNTSQPVCLLGQSAVCGSDDKTYPNICVMLLLGQSKKSDGWCPEPVIETTITTISYKTPNNGYLTATQNADPNSPCPCNSVYNPVCGNNGVSYGSRCRLECSNVALSHEGPCNYFNWAESPHFNCPCEYSFAPVCGQDGSTYENECTIKCGHQMVKHEGACMNPCNCSNIYKPVCSKKGKTFQNKCFMKCEKHKFFKKGKCPDRKPSHCSHCEGLVSPVCGTNGLTYDNRCYLKCAGSEVYNEGICPNDESYEGSKKKLPNCNTCRNIFLPVCGADENTYDSACKARCKGIAIKYKGKCLRGNKGKNKCGCGPNEDLVCGRDGRTYKNACEAKCKNISVMYNSACRPENPNYCGHLCGNAQISPVCGKDWKTYANECVASKCMKIPVRNFESCPSLHDENYPLTFEYAKLNLPQAPPKPQPMHRPHQHAPVQMNISQSVHIGASKPSGNIMGSVQQLDLKNKDSVIRTYKMLFPGGRAVDPKVLNYKAPLEKILKYQFKIDPSHL